MNHLIFLFDRMLRIKILAQQLATHFSSFSYPDKVIHPSNLAQFQAGRKFTHLFKPRFFLDLFGDWNSSFFAQPLFHLPGIHYFFSFNHFFSFKRVDSICLIIHWLVKIKVYKFTDAFISTIGTGMICLMGSLKSFFNIYCMR